MMLNDDELGRLVDSVSAGAMEMIERYAAGGRVDRSAAVAMVGMALFSVGSATINGLLNLPTDQDPGRDALSLYRARLSELN